MTTHTPWGQRDFYGYTNDPALDRIALARHNLAVLRAQGAPVSVIVAQLGQVLPICPQCGGLKPNPSRSTCSRACTMRQVREERRRTPRCVICGAPARPRCRTCSQKCAGRLRGDLLRGRTRRTRKRVAA